MTVDRNLEGNRRSAVRFFVRVPALVVFVGALLAGCATSGPGTDGPRSIVLVHPASGESVSSTYWRPPGSYDPRALSELSTLFRDRRTGQAAPVDPGLIDTLVELRQRLGLPESAPIHLTSGYRSAVTNASLARSNSNVAENSYHIRGQAADIRIPGAAPERVAEAAASMRRGGYALYPHTGHVHVDTGPFRTWTPKAPDHRHDGIQEARASQRAKPGPATPVPTQVPTQVAVAKPAPGVSDADAQRLRYMLVTLAAEDAGTAKDKRPTAVR
jgi:uncharacterized protein YcbK (DUF882 family)